METREWLIVVLLLVAAIAVGGWLGARWGSGKVGRGNRARLRRAQVAESNAERLLEAQGFDIEDRQVTARWSLEIDGEPREVSCRADLVVRVRRHPTLPRGARLVADVKTGERAPDPALPATRRQLLEYQLAFDCDGVLVVDMEREQVLHVRFPER